MAGYNTDDDLRGQVRFTPEEQANTEAMERRPENLAELDAEIAKARTPDVRSVLQQYRDKIASGQSLVPTGSASGPAAASPADVDWSQFKPLDSNGVDWSQFKPIGPEGVFERAGRIAQDPDGGLLPAAGSLVAAALPEGGKARGATGLAKDAAVDLAKGVVGLGESVVGLGNLATFGLLGKAAEASGFDPKSTNDFLQGLYSADRQDIEKNVSQAQGFFGTLKELAVNPTALVGRIIQSVPSTVAGGASAGVAVRALLPRAAEAAKAAGLAGAEAESFITKYLSSRAAIAGGVSEGSLSAGSIAEQGRQAGRDFSDYALPAVVGGAVTGAIGAGSGTVANKLGLGDIETDIAMRAAGKVGVKTEGGVVSRTLKEGAKEGLLEEAPQSANEAIAGNLAEGKPWDQDLGKQTAEGLVTGFGMGGGHAALFGGEASPARKPTTEEQLSKITDAPDIDSAAKAANDFLSTANDEANAAIDELHGLAPAAINSAADQELAGKSTDASLLTNQPAAGDAAVAAPVVSPVEQQRRAIDRIAELTAQANQAGTTAERENALAQRGVAQERQFGAPEVGASRSFVDLTPMNARQAKQRLIVMRDQESRQPGGNSLILEAVAHPSQKGAFAIAARPAALPSLDLPAAATPAVSPAEAQHRIETAALTGTVAQRKAEDAPRQEIISRAMQAVEQRGGVASPAEARIFQEAGLGRPYDRVDPSLAPALSPDEQLTQATGLAVSRAGRSNETQGASERAAGEVTQARQDADAARQRANDRGMAAQEQRAQTNAQARGAMQSTMAAAANAPTQTAPLDLGEVERIVAKPAFQRTAEELNTLRAATRALSSQEMTALQTAPALRTPEQKLTIKKAVERRASTAREGQASTDRPTGEGLAAIATDAREVADNELADKPAGGRTITKQGARTLRLVARLFGKKVVFFESQTSSDEGQFFAKQGDRVYINVRAKAAHLSLLGHELAHALAKDSPEAFKALADVVIAQQTENAEEKFQQYYGEGADLEERVADLIGNRFQEEDFWTGVFADMHEQLGADVAPRTIARITASFSRVINAFKKALGSQPGFQTDKLVKDLDAVKAAVRKAVTAYAVQQRIPAAKMEAEVRAQAGALPRAESVASSDRVEQPAEQPRDEAGKFKPFDEAAELAAAEEQVARADQRSSTERNDLPSYGEPTPNSISVVGVHYSKEPRTTLDSRAAGTGLKGADNERIARDGGIKDRIYFYVEKGKGVIPESGVGGYAHEVQLNNLYDAEADPLLLAEDNANPTKFEKAVADAGFDGYYRDSFRNDVGAAVLLGAHSVPVQQVGQGVRKPTGRTPTRSAPAERTGWRKTVADIRAARSLPSGALAPDRWSKVLKVALPEAQSALDKAGVFAGNEPLYKDELVRRFADQQRASTSRRDYVIETLLTPQERANLMNASAEKVVKLFNELPSGNELAATAFAARAKRGWYKESGAALVNVFGPDSTRFAALLAALSPQTSVEINLLNALNTWKNWVKAGRPTSPVAIRKVLGRSVQGDKGDKSVLNAWFNNSVSALRSEDPETVLLSGPKVNSFMLNLRGFVDEVTNDAWMANYGLVEQTLFKASGYNLKKMNPGKGPGYLAYSARVREAAKTLSDLTGDNWSPSEVQETVWSWAKTLYEAQAAAGEPRGARELVMDKAITDDMIRATPDFRTLLNESANVRILRDAGLSTDRINDGATARAEPGAAGEKAPFAADTQQRYELQAARRLEKLYTQGASAFRSRQELLKARKSTSRNEATLADFTPEKLPKLLEKTNWAVLTAEDPNATKQSAAKNREAMARLEEDLAGYDYLPVTGKYGDVQNGFIVTGITGAEALNLGRKYGQESILTRRGLVYSDGRPATPTTGAVEVYDKAPEDFYTEIPETGAYFQVGLDFEANEPAEEPDTIVAEKRQSPARNLDDSVVIDFDGRRLTIPKPRDAVRRLDDKITKFQELIKCLRA